MLKLHPISNKLSSIKMRRLYLAIFIAVFPFFAQAQKRVKIKTTPFGTINAGYSIINEILPEGYYYNPQTLLGSLDLWRRKKFSLYSELQLVQAFDNFNVETDYEIGANLGFMFSQMIFKRLLVSVAIGSGPHYVTVDTDRQARGFIFSDNVELGLSYELRKFNTIFNTKLRFRHISNAGIIEPNGGIDNLFLILGVARNLKRN